jgi:hypothetical protein
MYGLPIADHRALPTMTIERAHLTMQAHLECPITLCPVKRQAKARLVEAGHMTPADSPHIGF